jgi:Domain of unknown function (DUF4258)
MFERRISRDDVVEVIHHGEVIADYPDDVPFPSSLLLAHVKGRPLHAVIGFDEAADRCYVITAYDPDPTLWEADFRKRKSR